MSSRNSLIRRIAGWFGVGCGGSAPSSPGRRVNQARLTLDSLECRDVPSGLFDLWSPAGSSWGMPPYSNPWGSYGSMSGGNRAVGFGYDDYAPKSHASGSSGLYPYVPTGYGNGASVPQLPTWGFGGLGLATKAYKAYLDGRYPNAFAQHDYLYSNDYRGRVTRAQADQLLRDKIAAKGGYTDQLNSSLVYWGVNNFGSKYYEGKWNTPRQPASKAYPKIQSTPKFNNAIDYGTYWTNTVRNGGRWY